MCPFIFGEKAEQVANILGLGQRIVSVLRRPPFQLAEQISNLRTPLAGRSRPIHARKIVVESVQVRAQRRLYSVENVSAQDAMDRSKVVHFHRLR